MALMAFLWASVNLNVINDYKVLVKTSLKLLSNSWKLSFVINLIRSSFSYGAILADKHSSNWFATSKWRSFKTHFITCHIQLNVYKPGRASSLHNCISVSELHCNISLPPKGEVVVTSLSGVWVAKLDIEVDSASILVLDLIRLRTEAFLTTCYSFNAIFYMVN